MRKSYLSLEQRIHNAEGAQAAETLHARHAFLHAKSFGDAGYVAAYVTECMDTQFLSFQFSSRSTVIEVTGSHNHQT